MRVHEWEIFIEKSFELYEKDPLRCRYTIKNASAAKPLVLKVTDDKQCLLHALGKNELWKLEKFNQKFLEWMATGSEPLDHQTKEGDGMSRRVSPSKGSRRTKRKE